MAGYITLTNPSWIEFLQKKQFSEAVFWRKKRNFKVLSKGEPIYFLMRGSFSTNSERLICGYGTFDNFEVLNPDEAWNKYNQKLGSETKADFQTMCKTIYKNEDIEVGCICMTNITFLSCPVSIGECRIDFSPFTVSGKGITDEDCEKINLAIRRRNENG